MRGAHVALLDLAFVWNRSRAIPAALERFRPDVIGIGIAALDNECAFHSITFLPQIRWIVDRIRAATPAPIVAGGHGVTRATRDVLTYLGLAHGFVGGDVVDAARWLEAVGGEDEHARVSGAIRWNDSGYAVVGAEARSISDPPQPCAAAHDLVDYASYRRSAAAPVVPIRLAHGAAPRRREHAEIADELGVLAATRAARRAWLAGLSVGRESAHDDVLLEHLASRGAPLATELELLASAATRQRIALARAAGACALRLVHTGLSPGAPDESTLEAAADELRLAMECIGGKLPVRLEISIGGPGETRDSLSRKLALVDGLRPTPTSVALVPAVRLWDELATVARVRRGGFAGDSPIWPRFAFAPETEPTLADQLRRFVATRAGVSVDSDAYAPWRRWAHALGRRSAVWPAWRTDRHLADLPKRLRRA